MRQTWYAIGVFVILLRYAVRLRTVGIHGLRGDDYLALPYLVLYSINMYVVQITYYTGGNIDITADMVPKLSDHDVEILELGSKLEFLSWYSYPGCIWVLKFTVLFFYKRLTMGLFRRRAMVGLFWLCGLSYIGLCMTFGFSDNWRIRPLPGPECTFRPQNFWVLLWLNILTDAALLTIPIPILWHLRVSLKRKIGVAILLSSGVFVISTAVVRAVTTLGGAPSIININRWGFRETAVGLITVTLPVLSPLATRAFWRRGPYIRDYYDRIRGPREQNHARFGNWLGTVVLRYVDEEDGTIPRRSSAAKQLEEEGHGGEQASPAESIRKGGSEIYEMVTKSVGTSTMTMDGIEEA
ncbi:cation diffusion facilitator 1 protein [Colletotrichum tabaci]|uniref:Cation diffusion facilitator 1 protein n=1 Tax=Colletotrichum tabaci TaxID=1209068 RepID=A0AAV9TCG6_9PEZI